MKNRHILAVGAIIFFIGIIVGSIDALGFVHSGRGLTIVSSVFLSSMFLSICSILLVVYNLFVRWADKVYQERK